MSTESAIGLDLDFLRGIASDPSPYQRMKLATELAAFVSNSGMPPAERAAVLPILLKLASDEDVSVRRTIAQELELADLVPPDIAFAIAADDDEIALPFLAACRGLTDGTLVAIARVGDDARLCAIAGRASLPRHALAVLVKFGSVAVCRTLLANERIAIPIEGYRIIMSRFGAVTAVSEALRRRPDLPVEMRIKLAQINNDRVKVVLAKQGWVEQDRLDELVSEAEDHSFLQIAHDLDPADLSAMVRYLVTNHLVTGTLLCRAICHGETSFVIEALAQLADMPGPHVASVFATRDYASLAAIAERASLPEPCARLATLAMELGAGLNGDSAAYAANMVALLTEGGANSGYSAADISSLLSLIGSYGPDEVKPVTDALLSSRPRAA